MVNKFAYTSTVYLHEVTASQIDCCLFFLPLCCSSPVFYLLEDENGNFAIDGLSKGEGKTNAERVLRDHMYQHVEEATCPDVKKHKAQSACSMNMDKCSRDGFCCLLRYTWSHNVKSCTRHTYKIVSRT